MKSSLHLDEKKNNLRVSYFNGIFHAAMLGFTQDYFVPFLLVLGGTARQVGILNALPNLFSALIQIRSAELTDRAGSRKRMISVCIIFQTFFLFFLSLIALQGKADLFVFIIMVILITSFGAVSNPPWGSLLSDLVPDNIRGDYFGWRNRNLGFITVGVTLLAGLILQQMHAININFGFFLIFGLACLCRLLSWLYLIHMKEPFSVHLKENRFTICDFLRRFKESNFAKFVIFVALMNFSVNLASPYFAVLMLKDLSFSYLLYTIINIIATLMVFLSIRRWGQHADKVGNLKVIRLTAPLIGCLPLFWVINRHPFFLVFVQVLSGFVWGGFNLCSSNFIYDAVTPAKRTRCIAYFNLFNGLALCAGALLGGYLIKYLPALFGYKILFLFLVSSLLRVIVALVLPRKLKEVRPIEHIRSDRLFFSMVGIKPILGIERKTIHY